MKTNEIKNGSEVTINGRSYTIESDLGIGKATVETCPWIEAQYAVRGTRGAMAMMVLFKNGSGRLIFTSSGTRTENFYEMTVAEVIGYTLPVETLFAAAQ